MATPDVPEAVPQALYDQLRPIVDTHLDRFEAHIRADERARVLDEVQAALRDEQAYAEWHDGTRYESWMRSEDDPELDLIAAWLRDTLGAGGEG